VNGRKKVLRGNPILNGRSGSRSSEKWVTWREGGRPKKKIEKKEKNVPVGEKRKKAYPVEPENA